MKEVSSITGKNSPHDEKFETIPSSLATTSKAFFPTRVGAEE